MHFIPKKHPKFLKRLIFWSWLEHGVQQEVSFFGPKISVFGRNIQLLPYNPNFGQKPVCSPRKDRSFFHLGYDFLTFCSRVTAVFVKKKKRLTRQKVFPHPTVGAGAPSARNSPSALSAQALNNFICDFGGPTFEGPNLPHQHLPGAQFGGAHSLGPIMCMIYEDKHKVIRWY